MIRPLLPLSQALPDLTASILARTSGPACARLRDLACDLVDGTLPPDDQELAVHHLAHCQGCRDVISALEMLHQALPGLAAVDPGEAFLAGVLQRTRAPLTESYRSGDPFLSGWTRLMRRPRVALEAAYLATAAGLILAQLPLPGSSRPAGSTLASLVRTHPRTSTVWAQVPMQGMSRAVHASRARFLDAKNIARTSRPSGFTQRFAETWQRLVKTANSVWDWVRSKARGAALPSTEPSKAPSRSSL